MTAQVIALYFDIVPKKHRQKLADALNENVKTHNYTLSTGFIGTTYLLFALADNGYMSTAQKAFNEVFGGIFRENGELDWMRRFATLRFMAEFREGEGKLKVSDFPEMLDRANRLFLMS